LDPNRENVIGSLPAESFAVINPTEDTGRPVVNLIPTPMFCLSKFRYFVEADPSNALGDVSFPGELYEVGTYSTILEPDETLTNCANAGVEKNNKNMKINFFILHLILASQ
jgi:hypothetical protein